MFTWIRRGILGLLVFVSVGSLIANWVPGYCTLIRFKRSGQCDRTVEWTDGCLALVCDYNGVQPRSRSKSWGYHLGVVSIGRVDDAFNDSAKPIYRETSYLVLRGWLISMLAAVYPCWFVLRRRRRRRLANGCPKCGYDLSGNASGVCPECGARREDSV